MVRFAYLWNINFERDAEIARTYESLEDKERWQITNLFLLEKSPMLWIYAQRSDSPRLRKSEHQLADEFLAMRWARIRSECRSFVRDSAGAYQRSEEHTSELQSQSNLVCRLLLEKKNNIDTREPKYFVARFLHERQSVRIADLLQLHVRSPRIACIAPYAATYNPCCVSEYTLIA